MTSTITGSSPSCQTLLGSEPNPWSRAAAEESQCGRFPRCYWERPREERMALWAHRVICRAAYRATVAEDGAEALACLASVKIKRAKSDNLSQGQLEDVLHEGLGCCPPPPPTAPTLVSTPSGTGSPAKRSIHIQHLMWQLEGSEWCQGARAAETAKALVMSINRRRTSKT